MSTDTPDTQPDIPEQSWTNPFTPGHPLHDLYDRRVRNSQDLVILIDDYHARRGTGKTVASLQLAEGMDQTGGMTDEQATLRPEELRSAYHNQPKRSALVLDEGEVGASNRDAMTKTNKALREVVSMGRVEEKYVIVNTPSIGFIDKDIRLLADVWITMLAKGTGLVHYLKRQPYAREGSGKLLTEKEALIQFKDLKRNTRIREIFNNLTQEKKDKIRRKDGGEFVPPDEHQEALEKIEKETRKEVREEFIKKTMQHPDIVSTQTDLADAIDVSQSYISNLLNSD